MRQQDFQKLRVAWNLQKKETKSDDFAAKTSAGLFLEMRKNRFTKKLRLPDTVVTPNFKHDVRAAGGSILFDPLDALVGRTGDGANFTQDVVGHSLGRCFASA